MKINVPHIAKLANLPLDEKDVPKFESQLSNVLEYITKLEEVDVKNVPPTSQVTGLENVLRSDEASSSLTQAETLSNAPSSENGHFKVKGIFEDE